MTERDVVSLYGSILFAANDLRAAGESMFHCSLTGQAPTENILNDAKAAAERVLKVIAEYEDTR